MKEIFKTIITDFFEKEIKGIMHRDFDIPLQSKKIISLIGVRRCGKSYILFDIINKLRKKIDRKNILYVNFEDDRLFPLGLKDLDALLEGYFEMYPQKRNEKIYLFLDEVQVVSNWEIYVRRIYDMSNVHIYITGSSAKLLSVEIATSLRGRTITFEIFPFSFKEYLDFKEIDVDLNSSSSLSFIKNEINNYVINGGFPETISENDFISRKILSDYLELIVYKDIVERHGITNTSLLKQLNKYCFTNISTLVSFTKLYNDFKSQGYRLSKDTIFNYMSYLEDAFSIFTIPIYRNSIREEQRNPKKIYAIDNGFKKIYDHALSEDKSKLYENIVFLHFRRKTKNIFYFKQNQEVDFYIKLEDREVLANVSFEIKNEKTFKREIGSLSEAMKYFGLKDGFLITKDEKRDIVLDGNTIHIVPLYEFLLFLEAPLS